MDRILKKVEVGKFITTALTSILKLVKLKSLVAKYVPNAFHLRSICVPNAFHLRSIRVPFAFRTRSKMRSKAFQWKRGNAFSFVVRYHVLTSEDPDTE